MGKLVVSENVSLDGVMEDPTGEEGFEHGGWFLDIGDADRAAWAEIGTEQALDAAAMLMGRRSDEYFAPRWHARDGEWADRLNTMPKFVVSSTADEAQWSNATVLKGDVVEEVAKLKRETGGEIVVIGSRTLAQTLIKHDLVDEVRLIVFPVVLGSGERLFGNGIGKTPLRLTETRPLGDALVHLTYEVAR